MTAQWDKRHPTSYLRPISGESEQFQLTEMRASGAPSRMASLSVSLNWPVPSEISQNERRRFFLDFWCEKT